MPNSVDRVFLVNPARLGGNEGEGGLPQRVVDPSRVIPVVVIGRQAPSAGDLLLVEAVGGRWVAAVGQSASDSLPCAPCPIPRKNLTVSWTNPLFGDGSAPLLVSGSAWSSGCVNGLLYSLACRGVAIEFAVTYYLSGTCPTGQSQSCTSLQSNPLALVLKNYSCQPFMLNYQVTDASCPVLMNNGYTSFTITE